jgi:hypothetical protein
MSLYKPLAIRTATRWPHLAWVLYPPSPGGWSAPFYLAWVPMPLRGGWLHPRFRCRKPGCWRSWTWDQECPQHIGWDGDE